LVDRGFHPLAYRLMCLQAHYRSEMEFTWEGLAAALVRLKRLVWAVERKKHGVDSMIGSTDSYSLLDERISEFGLAISNDLATPEALTVLDNTFGVKVEAKHTLSAVETMDAVLGLSLLTLTRQDLRIRPITAAITEAEIEAALAARKEARAAKDFAKSDAIRDDLIAKGVEVMDGDPLGWDWKLDI
jgi:cysteinyl-tRNA synthetase